jgi:hypothetical protein
MRGAALVLLCGSFACGLIPKSQAGGGAPRGTFTANVTGLHLGSPLNAMASGSTTLTGQLNQALTLNGGNSASAASPSVLVTGPQFVLGGNQALTHVEPYWGNMNVVPRSAGSGMTFQFDDVLLNPFGFHGTFAGTFGASIDPEMYVFTNGEFTAFPDCSLFMYAGSFDCGHSFEVAKLPLPHTFSVGEPIDPPSYWARCPAELEAAFIDKTSAGPCANQPGTCLSTAAVFDGSTVQIGAATPMPCEKIDLGNTPPNYRCVAQVASVQASGCTWKVTGLAGPHNAKAIDGLLITASADAACALPSRFCGIRYPLIP